MPGDAALVVQYWKRALPAAWRPRTSWNCVYVANWKLTLSWLFLKTVRRTAFPWYSLERGWSPEPVLAPAVALLES
jgi:hypothetical protein